MLVPKRARGRDSIGDHGGSSYQGPSGMQSHEPGPQMLQQESGMKLKTKFSFNRPTTAYLRDLDNDLLLNLEISQALLKKSAKILCNIQ